MTTISTQIRDAIFSRIEAATWASAFPTLQKTPPPTVESLATPALGVFRVSEDHLPDGDYNVVPFRFKSTCDIVTMILVDSNDPLTADGILDQYVDQVQDLILNDGSFMTLKDLFTGTPLLEGMPRMSVSVDWPTGGSRYFGRASLTMSFAYRCFFAVVPVNDLRQIMVTVPPMPTPSLEIDLPGSSS